MTQIAAVTQLVMTPKLVAKDDEAANRFLYQDMREPWKKEFFNG